MTIDASLGYALLEPGPQDWGREIDNVPQPAPGVDLRAAHRHWRERVERDLQQRLFSGQLAIWYPVQLPVDQPIVPLFGGDPSADWLHAVDGIIDGALGAGARMVRTVDLTRVGVWRGLERYRTTRSAPGRLAASSLAPGASTTDVFAALETDSLINFVIDVLRAEDDRRGRNASARGQAVLDDLVRLLGRSSVDLAALCTAVQYALSLDPTLQGLSAAEQDRIEQYHHRNVTRRRGLTDELDELDHLLRSLARFERVRKPQTQGRGKQYVTLRGIHPGIGGTDHELAADLLGARLAREMNDLDRTKDHVTVVLGADRLSLQTLDAITAAATRNRTRIYLFFEHFAGVGVDQIGRSGASVGGFFRLGNHREAAEAADFLGKQHSFQLVGYSHGTTSGFEWGWSSSISSGTSSSRSWNIGRQFSRTMTSGSSRTNTSTTSGGQNVSENSNYDVQRVYEHLLQPAVFQALDTGALLLVDVASRSARLVSCSADVRESPMTSTTHYVEISE